MITFVCRTHTDMFADPPQVFPVNWKGKGCERCTLDNERRQEKRELERKRRAARRNGEEYVEEDIDA